MFDNSFSDDFICKTYLKFPVKLVGYSLILIIGGIIFLVLKLSFNSYCSYYVKNETDNIYSVMVPYQDIDLWLDSNYLYYGNRKYSYNIHEISKDAIYQNNLVYLPILIKIDKLSSSLPVLEISMRNEKTTIIDYLKTRLKGE